eukprot:Gb_35598 [translate_table: standard]
MASYEERFEKGEKRKRARNWEVDEIILLVQAKRNEWEKYESNNTRDRFESASDKWKKIVEYLQAQGLQERDTTQARMKWENIISDFKAIKDWNRRSGNAPFFSCRPSIVPQTITNTSSSKQQTEGLAGDREQGSTGKVKRNNNSISIAIVMSEMNTSIQSAMAEAETNQNLRYEHLMELEREKMTVEREDRNKLMATKQEDRNKLIKFKYNVQEGLVLQIYLLKFSG